MRPAPDRAASGDVTTALPAAGSAPGLWQVYDQSLKGAKYIDLTHTLTPSIPVWAGFGPAKFGATVHPDDRAAVHVRPGLALRRPATS